ncbi:MAG: type I restriction enzyme HsdR N-terminal domain-containing protein [Coleofasciculaceae cyanobacterium SM2_1_6]|nr:type I restriction enzyme HsdR N-terminal domain-containing protein [Coleofasciculaceae cyanobacterium SM2_1_6]
MITNASSLTRRNLHQTFGLRFDPSDYFFDEWLSNAPNLTEAELQGLDRLTRNYTYLSQEEPPLEEIVKLVVVSPLLDLAGFYQFPFLVKAEVSTSIEVADEADAMAVQGRIDILVIQDSFWILAIESKPARLDVTAGIPQALTYLLRAPKLQTSCYGMVTNGREVLFLKCDRQQNVPQYTRSPTYRLIENTAERIQVLQGLKRIGAYISDLRSEAIA